MTNCRIIHGDARDVMASMGGESVQTVVTSPPYWGLRDYGDDGQLGLEATPEEYVAKMVEVFREVRRVLRDDGTLWLNLGDSYSRGDRKSVPTQRGEAASSKDEDKYCFDSPAAMLGDHPTIKPKDLIGIPWRVAFALQADGWYLRQDIIWSKPNPMPESVTDRCTKAHEYIFLLTKSQRYYYDAEAIREKDSGVMPYGGSRSPKRLDERGTGKHGKTGIVRAMTREEKMKYYGNGRNKRSVWTVTTKPYPNAHFATFPPDLIEPCILAGCPLGGTVLDPFSGSGTTGEVALQWGRKYIGIELNETYIQLSERRIAHSMRPATSRDMDNREGLLFGGDMESL